MSTIGHRALKTTKAWAVVGKKSSKMLRSLGGHYTIYTHRDDAVRNLTSYGVVRRVIVRVIEEGAKNSESGT